MDVILPLIGLALVDSLSIGTLVLPLALILVWGRLQPRLYALYLAVVAGAYFGIGVALLLGLSGISRWVEQASAQQWFSWLTLAVGVALAIYGILAPTPKKPEPGTEAAALPSRVASGTVTTPWGIAAIAGGAAVAESATMLPYLGAMTMIGSLETSLGAKMLWTAGYCLVMVLPALAIGILVSMRGQGIIDRIRRATPRLAYEGRVTLLWIAAIVGIHLIYRSAARLGLLERLG